jgi:hypothetical protein
MTFEKLKYRVIQGFSSAPDFELSVNGLAEAGYGVAHFAVSVDGKMSAMLKLKDDPAASFKAVDELVNVDITPSGEEIKAKLAEGWEIIASYAKTVTLIRRRPKEASP